MTDSFGARLRRQREQKQLTLAQIAASTKINVALFRALEKDDVSRWPSGIFRRSFIRAYAEAIGLDPDSVCREFLERFPDADGPAPIPATPLARVPAQPVAGAAIGAAPRAGPGSTAGLRLTLAETRQPFSGGQLLRRPGARWRAVTWDGGTLLAVSLTLFVVLDAFWMPLGIAALCYYAGSILVLGNTPGVCLFAPRPRQDPDAAGVDVAEPLDTLDEGLRQLEEATSASLSISSEVRA
jgi:transcriptional regulator with XRE-family HTH domain